jgi:subtilisin family serine protease
MKLSGLLFFLLAFTSAEAQYSKHIVQFTNKGGTPYTLGNPSAYLSSKAIARRTRYNIQTDSADLPAPPRYLDSLRAAGSVVVHSYSKWLNQALIITTDAAALTKISQLPFVKSASPIATRAETVTVPEDKFSSEMQSVVTQAANNNSVQADLIDYGSSYAQVHIHEGEYLHNLGFMGQGVTIAMLDAGYYRYDVLTAFDSLRNNNQILGVYDFVKNETSVSEDNAHGMYCFSILAANRPGALVGTAPKSSYYLFRTEDVASEYPVEEHHWVVAAERADSLGADIISSSLGYTTFDISSFNHTYSDLNGRTTMITNGADMAMKKGMIVCNSAGNAGASSWKYIGAPADGDSVFAIGAVNAAGVPANFSSYGPSSDGRIKPNVTSVGWGTFFIYFNDMVAQGNGTSFSCPNLAGLIACLWQAFPEFTNMEILDAVQRSSNRYTNPDDRVGYGIPNMHVAFDFLVQKKREKLLANDWVKAFPNPFTTGINIFLKANTTGKITMQLTDMAGRRLKTVQLDVQQGQYYTVTEDNLGRLPSGVYNLRIVDGNQKRTIRLVK